MPRVSVIATGGTIAWHDAEGRMVPVAELLAGAGVTVDGVRDIASLPSWDLSIEGMSEIAGAVDAALDEGSDAVVVTHGTDTLEETSWLTELLLGSRRRAGAVMFTGAMRFWDHPQTDGPENLRAAIAAARGSAGRASGVQAHLAGRTHAARWIRKVDAAALDCFDSSGRPDTALPPPAVTRHRLGPRVPVVKVGPFGPEALPQNVGGIVLEGTGAAHVPSRYHDQIHDLAERGIPVVLASRCRDVRRDHSGTGLVLTAGDLTPEKAALALMVALGQGLEPEGLRQWWTELIEAGR